MNYGNCARCGKLVAFNHVRICPACKEKELEKIKAYLNENGKTKTDVLCKSLGIPKRLIVEFIMEGSLEPVFFNPDDVEQLLEEERKKELVEHLNKMNKNNQNIEENKRELKVENKMRFLNRRK